MGVTVDSIFGLMEVGERLSAGRVKLSTRGGSIAREVGCSVKEEISGALLFCCLLYTSDAADD